MRGVRGLERGGFDGAAVLQRYCQFTCRITRGVSDFHRTFLVARRECFAAYTSGWIGDQMQE